LYVHSDLNGYLLLLLINDGALLSNSC